MFKTVLVANRGEIACRVIRTLKAMGIGSVAVFHHRDRSAPHVSMADAAVELCGDVPTAAYLDGAQIIAACRKTGAEALHPGYGFLSENADFAEAVGKAGIAFIGPGAEAMRLMGDKIRSRDFAAANGVPVAPSVMQTGTMAEFEAAAAKIGFPLLIKASAGGGGKGMKVVRSAGELAESAVVAASEALRYFKDGRIYAERLVERPRHIEVQVMGDAAGTVVHLFERECSIQRRYQKIVEESPAPNLARPLRDEICAAAVRLARAAKYRNAGTVEFILDKSGAFYFLEMNTRLQVEHPVTEAVTGIDLVAEQIRIAAGEPLSFSQATLKQSGHAIECRICAEEPDKDFRPATGRIGVLHVPAADGVRFDGGIREGLTISAAFDSMLAKLIAYAPSRAEATARMAAALEELVVLGVPTNIDYLGRIIRSEAFAGGATHTGFLAENAEALGAPESDPTLAVAAIAAALSQPSFRRTALETPEPYASIGSWRN
jgi:propionyl-CoA carboxylase alpha chain/3-methylcrotonyl-CoA carboxylase alpha subunit/acetyl-CoA/propionyl-CoA carboxylase biotin carboxyl carrier protein